jgi:acetyl esterase
MSPGAEPPGLDDASRELLRLLAEHDPAPGMPVEAIRAAARALTRRVAGDAPAIARVVDERIAGPGGPLAIRAYLVAPPGRAGALLWLHGGGFTSGGLDQHDTLCRRLAAASGTNVVAVGYRLAPEHRFPAAVDDADAALRWLAAQGGSLGIDTRRLAVGGSSAGGNLAAAAALRARDEGLAALRLQVLVYPVLDATTSGASHVRCGEGYQLTAAMMRAYLDLYVAPGTDRRAPRLSPLHAASLAGTAPACVVVAELDPLRDEVEAYADRLAREGVPVERRLWTGVMHGFFGQAGVHPKGDAAQRFVAEAVARAVGPPEATR